MVYLRVPTVVFYIIQASGYRISALQHFREVRRQVSTSRMVYILPPIRRAVTGAT
jgi:hypothetical protein